MSFSEVVKRITFLKTEVIQQTVGGGNTITEVSTLVLWGIECSVKSKSDSVEKQMENS